MKSKIWSLALFWRDFVVGDDWTIAAGVVAALAVTYFLSSHGSPLWWILPSTVALLLGWSVFRALAEHRGDEFSKARAVRDSG